MLAVLISGVVTGALYAITSIAFVIIYKSSRIANFALGGASTLSVYVAYQATNAHVPWIWLLVIAVVAGAVGGMITDGIVLLLGKADLQAYVVATFAVFLVTQGLILTFWSPDNKPFPALWDVSQGWKIAGVLISYQSMLIVAIALVVTFGLHLIVQRTRFGLAVRMASSGPMTAQLLGLRVTQVRFWTWVIGGALGAIACIFISPTLSLSPSGFTSFMMVALVALILGGFTNLRGAALGGLLLGIVLNVLGYWLTPTLTETYLFVIVAILLFFKPDGLLGSRDGRVPEPTLPSMRFHWLRRTSHHGDQHSPASRTIAPPAPTRFRDLSKSVMSTRVVLMVLGAALLVTLPLIAPDNFKVLLPGLTATYLAVLGMNVIVGYSGQLSVGQSAFMAVGAYAGGVVFTHVIGLPALLMLPLGLVGGLIFGLIVGLPAVRLGPLFLTLLTLVLAFAVPELITFFAPVTGGTQGLLLAVPNFLFDQSNQYWIGAAIAVVCTVIVYFLRHATIGRRWIAVRDSPSGARSVGINPATAKLGAFVVASGLTGLAGAMSSTFTGFVTPTDYSPLLSITLLVAVVVGGIGRISGSVVGAILLSLVTAYAPVFKVPPDLVLGVVLIVVLIASPAGLADLIARLLRLVERLIANIGRRAGIRDVTVGGDETRGVRVLNPTRASATTRLASASPAASPPSPAPTSAPVTDELREPALLRLSGLTAGYAEAKVLNNVTLAIPEGSTTALVGSNGAGKTTILRVISGLIRPADGSLEFDGKDISQTSPDALARSGIAHVPEGRGIFPDLTVRENLQSAAFTAPGHDINMDDAFATFPALQGLLGRMAGSLSGGEQQMLAVGRALLTKPRLLLLDEPTLGLSPLISKNLMAALGALKGTGLSVLIVEQNARAALAYADRAYVMSAGEVVTQGASEDLLQGEILTNYLGVKA
ncbi:MAG: ATP-binding cassette domain-containing protein [Microbacteriaceae bacterium]|nr:MAG: ATP-binding cassette domain-containing protein [Microbacteriaceae bacterium]